MKFETVSINNFVNRFVHVFLTNTFGEDVVAQQVLETPTLSESSLSDVAPPPPPTPPCYIQNEMLKPRKKCPPCSEDLRPCAASGLKRNGVTTGSSRGFTAPPTALVRRTSCLPRLFEREHMHVLLWSFFPHQPKGAR